ncbi:hypothetical protein SMACR_04165 [Sordaria macrospora]|uniref:Carboxylic ester hydrolase n=1 Tax=Sordaria macrospora TaxID=5147 RepID=A0A8S8ZMC5_SORMA|nr:hypothetical protein SMACR_04165 [Sordaria macrospora]WPJ64460.1 hypothetical protein SMAC4_04165 [Sordaria macrospora]
MANVLAATYPQLISAVSVYSGVPAGCFMSSSGGVANWNNSCSGGNSRATAQRWGDVTREMFPEYDYQDDEEGKRRPRPRMQIWHGSSDGTVSPNNYGEQVKQWTNVLGVPGVEGGGMVNGAPKGNVERKDYPAKGYTASEYTDKEGVVWVEGIWAQGVGHSVPANLSASEAWAEEMMAEEMMAEEMMAEEMMAEEMMAEEMMAEEMMAEMTDRNSPKDEKSK